MVDTQAGVELESFVSDVESGTYQGRYDPDSMSVSMGVIAMLSKVRNSCPTELEPLQSFVDTDALDEFFKKADFRAKYVSVTFPVAEFTVSVYGSGKMTVTSDASEVNVIATNKIGQNGF
jgi:hypothetical protein